MGKKRARKLSPGTVREDRFPPRSVPDPELSFCIEGFPDKSDRPAETIAPLAAALKLTPDEDFKNKKPEKLAEELKKPKYDGKTVLVCWHHGEIPALLHALGIDPEPDPINKKVFDRVWVVTYDDKGKAKLTVKPQTLLPDDPKE